MTTHALSPKTIFRLARILQTELGAWRGCPHAACDLAKHCQGGPRGTCLKTGGWPLCTQEGRERNTIARSRKIWPGEDAPDDETLFERRIRRFEENIRRMNTQAELENSMETHRSKSKATHSIPPI